MFCKSLHRNRDYAQPLNCGPYFKAEWVGHQKVYLKRAETTDHWWCLSAVITCILPTLKESDILRMYLRYKMYYNYSEEFITFKWRIIVLYTLHWRTSSLICNKSQNTQHLEKHIEQLLSIYIYWKMHLGSYRLVGSKFSYRLVPPRGTVHYSTLNRAPPWCP